MNKDLLSIIIPVYNEEKNIPVLYKELKEVLGPLDRDYEVIFVNDGSSDGSLRSLKDIASGDQKIKVLSFSRNFGQTAALVCGINSAKGETVVLMDADLQNDPLDIPKLIDKLNEGYDVVSGWRKDRKDTFLTRILPSVIANRIISCLSGVRLHDYGCTLKAYKKDVLKDMKLYGEMHRFIPIYASWLGAKIIELEVNHRPRKHGKSKYNLYRSLKVVLDLVTVKFIANYRTKPIYIFGGAGVILIGLSFLCVFMLIYNKLANDISMIQSPFLILSSLLVIVGAQSILMGLLAEIETRTYYESLNKPIYTVKEKINI
ncbi:MAG: glycosyltransferase family 2 protein [Candidatus Omnitrophota bacterium]